MLSTAGGRTRYLTLALASRKLIDSLLHFVESGEQDPNLGSALVQFIRSLEATSANADLFRALTDQPGFSHYEQVLALQEVVGSLSDRNIVGELQAVLDEGADRASRTENARRAVDFFYALEGRALNNYNQQIGLRDS